LKIAFDEHIPQKLANAFKALDGEEGMLRVEIVSARDYPIPKGAGDVPWIQQFAEDDGKIIISGDAKMRGKLHEQQALSQAGLVVFFLARRWNNANYYDKSSMLMRWWPQILKKAAAARAGNFFEIPFDFDTDKPMRDVTPPTKPKAKRPRRSIESAKSEPNTGEPAVVAKPESH
jgi:hypothetical protein